MFDQLGLPIWLAETLSSLAIVVGAWIIAGIVAVILNLVKKHVAGRTSTELDDQIIDAAKRPLTLMLVLAGVALALKRLQLNFPEASAWIFKASDAILVTIIAIVVTIFLLRLLKILTTWYAQSVAARTQSALDDQMLPLANRLIKIVIIGIALVTVLSHFNIDVKGVLAVLGVGSLAIALAAQDTIANMISGFIIMLDRPFNRGDRVILSSGETVDVYDIGLRSSKFLTFDNTLIVVPNLELVRSKVNNLSYPADEIRVTVELALPYGSDIDQVKSILVQAASEHPDVLKEPKPAAFLTKFGQSELHFLLSCRVARVSQQFGTGEELRCRIYRDLRSAGIEMALTQQLVSVSKEAGKK
jgi:small-conductance mechanosensitive channel